MIANIGGLFLYSENPKQLADWYSANFDLSYEFSVPDKCYGLSLSYKELDSDKKRYIVFSINKIESRPVVEGKIFTLNLRVHDIGKTIDHLTSKGIEVKGAEVHPEGKFGWLQDPDGNHIEIWEDLP